jgi:hypothetical protein
MRLLRSSAARAPPRSRTPAPEPTAPPRDRAHPTSAATNPIVPRCSPGCSASRPVAHQSQGSRASHSRLPLSPSSILGGRRQECRFARWEAVLYTDGPLVPDHRNSRRPRGDSNTPAQAGRNESATSRARDSCPSSKPRMATVQTGLAASRMQGARRSRPITGGAIAAPGSRRGTGGHTSVPGRGAPRVGGRRGGLTTRSRRQPFPALVRRRVRPYASSSRGRARSASLPPVSLSDSTPETPRCGGRGLRGEIETNSTAQTARARDRVDVERGMELAP